VTAPAVLVCNAGSSSLKAELWAKHPRLQSIARIVVERVGTSEARLRIGQRDAERVDAREHGAAAHAVLDALARSRSLEGLDLVATGHRVVHGGERFRAPVVVTAEVRQELESLGALAPLHNPPALAVLDATSSAFAAVPAVAVFDTAFFAALPEAVRAYAVPKDWRERFGIQRFGFHGIAHEYLHGRYAQLAAEARCSRVVSLHLGQGCSITAIRDGAPVETSMGYTPLEGLVMGTRPGDLDAGVLVRLMRAGLGADEIDAALQRASGLRGLSGASDDVRELAALEARGDRGAALALEVFCHRARKYLGAYAAVLGGVDAVLFGGGIGEHQPKLRARICEGLAWLGLELDAHANEAAVGKEARISAASSRIAVYVIPVHEELAIARAAFSAVGSQ